MYSSEILRLLQIRKYLIDSETYFKICKESPQINRILYEPSSDYFSIWTDDNFYFHFKVKRKDLM